MRIEKDGDALLIPLKQEYTLIIGKNSKGYKCVVEKILTLVDNVEYLEDLDIIRFEEYEITFDEIKKNILDGFQYLVWSDKGPTAYQLMQYKDGFGFTTNNINYH
jgi:hypothetical protein